MKVFVTFLFLLFSFLSSFGQSEKVIEILTLNGDQFTSSNVHFNNVNNSLVIYRTPIITSSGIYVSYEGCVQMLKLSKRVINVIDSLKNNDLSMEGKVDVGEFEYRKASGRGRRYVDYFGKTKLSLLSHDVTFDPGHIYLIKLEFKPALGINHRNEKVSVQTNDLLMLTNDFFKIGKYAYDCIKNERIK